MRAAPINAPHVKEFCLGVAAGQEPITVLCQPIPNQPENECFSVLPQHVSSFGGEQIIGWAIWERPGVFIEAEFHAVWRNPSGEYVDISSREIRFDAITFLPDPNRKYLGRQVDNVRKSLVKDHDVTRFLYLAKRRFEILNSGNLADQHGYIALPKKLEREYMETMKELARLQKRLATRYPPSHSA